MSANASLVRKRNRCRYKISKVANGKPRLSVFRSNKNIYAQLLDLETGKVIVSASTLDKEIGKLKSASNKDAAKAVGGLIAKKALDKKIKEAVFDRSGYIYHGRIRTLAESAREAGLKF